MNGNIKQRSFASSASIIEMLRDRIAHDVMEMRTEDEPERIEAVYGQVFVMTNEGLKRV